MNNKPFAIAAIALALPVAGQADTLGFRVEASAWQQQYEGSVQDGPNSIDIENTLGLDDETNNVLAVSFEHPIPLIPNIALRRTELEAKATNTIDEEIIFGDVTYAFQDIPENVTTNADLSHTDATLYYELLDNWVSLDLGLTVRAFDEGVILQSETAGRAELDIDGALPLLYGAVKFELPLSGLYVGADVNGISYKESSMIDYRVKVGYETDIGLGLEAGVRSFDIDYEDEDDATEQADLTIDGAYASIFYHF